MKKLSSMIAGICICAGNVNAQTLPSQEFYQGLIEVSLSTGKVVDQMKEPPARISRMAVCLQISSLQSRVNTLANNVKSTDPDVVKYDVAEIRANMKHATGFCELGGNEKISLESLVQMKVVSLELIEFLKAAAVGKQCGGL